MTLYTKEDPASIRQMFDRIAKNYERGNAVLSFQTYRLWNRSLMKHCFAGEPEVILDLCAGTGDISLPYLKNRTTPCKAHILDFSPGMLSIAKEKSKKWNLSRHSLDFIEGDAHKIPLPATSVDRITVAYGIRNLKEPRLCYQEAYRVLKPGGTFGILELTRPSFTPLRLIHGLYLRLAMPLIGKFITSDKDAYRYLCESIHHFVSPAKIKEELAASGFQQIEIRPLLGGIATIILANKT